MDPYEILGIPVNATREEIKKAYRREAMKWHPDRNNNSSESEARFHQAADAYKILSEKNSAQNNRHTRTGPSAGTGYQGPESEASGYSSNSRHSDYESKDNFAGELFWEVMLDFAIKLAQRGMRQREIFVNLSQRGCPDRLATSIAEKAFSIHAQYASNPGKANEKAMKQESELLRAFIGARNILWSPRGTVEYYLMVFSQFNQTAGSGLLSRINPNSRLMKILGFSILFFALFVMIINYYPGRFQFGNLTELTLLQLPIGILSWMLIWTIYRKLWVFTLMLGLVYSVTLFICQTLIPQALNNDFEAILLIAVSCYLPFTLVVVFANYFYYRKAQKTITLADDLFFDHREKMSWIKNRAGTSTGATFLYFFLVLLMFQAPEPMDIFDSVTFALVDRDEAMVEEENRLRSIEAEAGHFFNIAESHFYGSPPDYLKASTSYSIAADKRSLLAAYQLGYMYYHGVGVKQNDSLALDYFQLAIRAPLAYQPHSLLLTSGYLAESYNNLGIMYQKGFGTRRDTKKAIAMFRKGAKFGSSNARVNLRTVYSQGANSKRKALLKPDY